jgi:hypothetical protein
MDLQHSEHMQVTAGLLQQNDVRVHNTDDNLKASLFCECISSKSNLLANEEMKHTKDSHEINTC